MNTAAPTPRPHQLEAMAGLDDAFAGGSRAQLIMACGSGKTLLGRFYAERIQAELTVVVVPSLGLVAQTLSEWRAAPGWAFQALITCSDPSTADGVGERVPDDGQDVGAPVWAQLHGLVTTNEAVVANLLALRPAGRPLVIFSTYHSVHVVAAAVRSAGLAVDLVIADEAHVLAGRPSAAFQTVLTEALPTKRRVFMTATQVVGAGADAGDLPSERVLSMGDVALFGPVAYRLDFAEAIAQGLLVDYQVLVYETPAEQMTPDPLAALAAACGHGVSSVLSFHGRVAKAHAFAAALDGAVLPDGRTVIARSIAGADSTATRSKTLALLSQPQPDQLVLVASARCLSAGINVPAVDGVLFADPKNSDVDVIQSVGRALRVAPGKASGLVMIPVCVPAGLDDDTVLSTGSFKALWRVLRGLRSMDRRLAAELNTLVHNPSRRGTHDHSRVIDRVRFDISSLTDPGVLQSRVVDLLSPAWDKTLAELKQFASDHGHLHIPRRSRLGEWCYRQRVAHRCGMLAPERVELLAAVPGWAWDQAEQRWLQQCEQVRRAAAQRGGLDLEDTDFAATPIETPDPKSRARTIGRWCAQQRQRQRRGELSDWQHAKLSAILGWDWTPLSERDAVGVDVLAEYVAWKGHANPPADAVEDGMRLGKWLNEIRRRRVTGHLSQALLDELWVAAPSEPKDKALNWYRGATLWLLGIEALRQFAAREGHSKPPSGHIEALVDHSVALNQWCGLQRHLYRHGKLIPARARLLEQIIGWKWDHTPEPGEPIDIGETAHGTRTGYTKGCRCVPCGQANAADAGKRAAAAAAGLPTTDLIEAAAAREHIAELRRGGASLKSIVRASGLSRTAVSGIACGDTRRIMPDTHQAIVGLTAADVRAAAAPKTLVDAGPTWALLDDMIARGWPKSWIARELGLNSSLQLRRDTVTAASAAKVDHLAKCLGDRTPPPRRRGRPMPRLSQILSDTAPQPEFDVDTLVWARSLLDQGYQVERVAQRSNLPTDVVRTMLVGNEVARRTAS